MRNDVLSATGESIFSTVTRWAQEHDAVDLGQGYPSYNPPSDLVEELSNIGLENHKTHQYAPSAGLESLRECVADLYDWKYDLEYDPINEITITTGATEALSSALYGLLNQGDNVLVIEPVYDLYVPVIRRAGANVVSVQLQPDDFSLPISVIEEKLRQQIELLVLNNPHNPTGTVFSKQSLRQLVQLCERNDVYILSDEVYEHLVFEPEEYSPVASIPGARERTLTIGSAGKMLDATGWKTGWCLAPSELTESVRQSHQFTTFASATPIQKALTQFMKELDYGNYMEEFRDRYRDRLQHLLNGLENSVFNPIIPDGTYFLPVRLELGRDILEENIDDREIVKQIIKKNGVATIPISSFCLDSNSGSRIFRLAFCKETQTLEEGAKRLSEVVLGDL